MRRPFAAGIFPQVALEVSDERDDPQPRVLRCQRLGRVGEDRGIDVERHELAHGATFAERPQQQAGLGRVPRRARPATAPREFGDLTRARSQDRRLGPGRVVLGQPGDLLEQLAAALVVEVLRRQ
jgi:hypothetical protein